MNEDIYGRAFRNPVHFRARALRYAPAIHDPMGAGLHLLKWAPRGDRVIMIVGAVASIFLMLLVTLAKISGF